MKISTAFVQGKPRVHILASFFDINSKILPSPQDDLWVNFLIELIFFPSIK